MKHNIEKRFKYWMKAKGKENLKMSNLDLQDKLELLAFGVAPFDITQ